MVFSRLFCTLNLNIMTFISNGYLVPFSRETEKMGEFLRFCRLLTPKKWQNMLKIDFLGYHGNG